MLRHALANTLAALQRGVTTSWQLHGLGVATGIDLPKLVDTSVWMAEQLGRPSPSRTVTALAGG